MRVAADDVIRSPSSTVLAYLLAGAVVMGAIFVVHPLPVEQTDLPTEPDAREDDASTATAAKAPDGEYKGVNHVYVLKILYVCDATSAHFCDVNATGNAVFAHFKDELDYGGQQRFLDECGNGTACGGGDQRGDGRPFLETLDYDADDGQRIILTKRLFPNTTIRLNVTFCVAGSQGIRDRISVIDGLAASEAADVVVAVGDASTVQTVALVADGRDIPSVGYITEYEHGQKVAMFQNVCLGSG
ncbi:hypothetical protein Btru_039884 [Bulinus truncatus]|nr:hypothetical protein Btru_039884 [Bulinus truncatus]